MLPDMFDRARIKGRYPRNLTDGQQRRRLARNDAARVRRAQRKRPTP